MSHAALHQVLPQLRRFLDAQSARELTDGMLLERFVARRDEAAFALLAERHGPMVFGER